MPFIWRVLLSSDSDIGAAIGVNVLSDFMQALSKAAVSQLERMKSPFFRPALKSGTKITKK